MNNRVAFLSLHGCPVARLGEKDTGGMNVYLKEIAKHLGQLGIETDIYTRTHDPDDDQIIELGLNARVIHLKAGGYKYPKEDLHETVPEFIESLLAFQKREGLNYNVVHSHYWVSGFPGIELSKLWAVPHVSTFHTLAKSKLKARAEEKESELRIDMELKIIQESHGIVVSTESEVTDIHELYCKSERSSFKPNIRVIAPGVDLNMFKPADRNVARNKLGLSADKIIIYAGRVEPLKGIDIAIEAVAQLEQQESLKFLVIGGDLTSDSSLSDLKTLTSSLELDDTVEFIGSVTQSNLVEYYRAADVLIFPSYYESFGLVALEAMACGIPVIASRVGGLKTLIKNGETGYLIPFRCAEPFTEKLEIILANPSLRDAMGNTARLTAMGLGWEKAAEKLANFYNFLSGQSCLPSRHIANIF